MRLDAISTYFFVATLVSCGSQPQESGSKQPSSQSPLDLPAQESADASQTADQQGVTERAAQFADSKLQVCPGHAPGDDCESDTPKVSAPPKSPIDADTAAAPTKPLPAVDPAPSPTPPNPAAKVDPNIILFHIKAGTGKGPWNTKEQMLTVKVGSTLRIVNDDTTIHRLHTNGKPCPHGAASGVSQGQSFDCKINSQFDPNAAGPLYDHLAGTAAQFWVKAVNP